MEKILVSWIAYREDFGQFPAYREENKLNQFNPKGPTFSFHENFWENYDKHIIISSHNSETDRGKKDVKEFNRFCKDLETIYHTHTINKKNIPLDDPSDLRIIIEKIQILLRELQGNEVHTFISPGTSAMQTAWYFTAKEIPNTLIKTHFDRKSQSSIKTIVDLDYSLGPQQVRDYNQSNKQNYTNLNVRLESESLKSAYQRAKDIAINDADIPALIFGENGTGKEHIAKTIVEESSRCDKPYIPVNCAGYTDELLRSELFGYVKGAFTGANQDTKGIFEQAKGGTVFLDEIGDISPFMQANLLRVLQEKTIQKVGSPTLIKIDVRVIAATNKDLWEMCKTGNFRTDLYYRLNPSISINLPPLRKRGNEILDLIEYFNDRFSKERKKEKLIFSSEALSKLREYEYPGNVRELEGIILSLFVFSKNKKILLNDLPDQMFDTEENSKFDYNEAIKRHLIYAYENGPKKANGAPHMSKIAEKLGDGISKQTFQNKLRDYGVWGTDD